jgi:hypothetical protein
VQQ